MKRTDFSQLNGIEQIKRAIEIALAGYHVLHIMSKPHNGNTTLSWAIRNIFISLQKRDANWHMRQTQFNKSETFLFQSLDTNDPVGEITIHLENTTVNTEMAVECPHVTIDHYLSPASGEPSENVVERISVLRQSNPCLLKLDKDAVLLLKRFCTRYDSSVGVIGRIHEVASTIALLDHSQVIRAEHLAESSQYFYYNRNTS